MLIAEIKNRLKALGISLKEFAEELGIAYSTFRGVMSGQNKMTLQLERHILLLLEKKEAQLSQCRAVPIKLPAELVIAFQNTAKSKGVDCNEFMKQTIKSIALVLADAIILGNSN